MAFNVVSQNLNIFGNQMSLHDGLLLADISYPPLGSLRMLGGSGPFGVVEIFNGARWGPICDVEFDQEDGEVVCRQLGYTGIIRTVHNS